MWFTDGLNCTTCNFSDTDFSWQFKKKINKSQPSKTPKNFLDLWPQDVKMLKSASGMNLLTTEELGAGNMGQNFMTD